MARAVIKSHSTATVAGIAREKASSRPNLPVFNVPVLSAQSDQS